MTDERRYDEQEVAEIFGAATDTRTARGGLGTTGAGLTLRDLHEIAEEAGIPTELVTLAARRIGPDPA